VLVGDCPRLRVEPADERHRQPTADQRDGGGEREPLAALRQVVGPHGRFGDAVAGRGRVAGGHQTHRIPQRAQSTLVRPST
jgi:hypothetical protein